MSKLSFVMYATPKCPILLSSRHAEKMSFVTKLLQRGDPKILGPPFLAALQNFLVALQNHSLRICRIIFPICKFKIGFDFSILFFSGIEILLAIFFTVAILFLFIFILIKIC